MNSFSSYFTLERPNDKIATQKPEIGNKKCQIYKKDIIEKIREGSEFNTIITISSPGIKIGIDVNNKERNNSQYNKMNIIQHQSPLLIPELFLHNEQYMQPFKQCKSTIKTKSKFCQFKGIHTHSKKSRCNE